MAFKQNKTKFRITLQKLRQAWEEEDFMTRGNTPRWFWLMETFKGLSPDSQSIIRQRFAERYDLDTGQRDDVVMYEIMTGMGLILKGVDPCPPPKVYPTDAGAAEYDEVMVIQELGKAHDINNA